jgi:magnesium transporter
MAERTQRNGTGRGGETAAHYLMAAVPKTGPAQTVEEALAALRGRRYDSVEILCVVDAEDKLLGCVAIADLLALPHDHRVSEAMNAEFPRVLPDVDQEKVASLALHHVLNAIPVVDRHGRLLGVVPNESLLHILRREHVEDLHRIAGIGREAHRAREAIEAPPLRRARHRLPWLLLGLAGSMLATFVMSRFEQALSGKVAIAFFIPGLVYLADAIGTQTEAVAVRGLSLSHAKLGRLIGGELRTGLLIGLTLGGITFPAAWLAFGDPRLAFAVTLALLCAGGVATTIGLFLPWMLGRLGSDPAYGSGPLATIIQDVLSLVIYFATVTAIVL